MIIYFIIGAFMWIAVMFLLFTRENQKESGVNINKGSLTPPTANKKPKKLETNTSTSIIPKEEIIPQRREVSLSILLTEEKYTEEYVVDLTRTVKELIENDEIIAPEENQSTTSENKEDNSIYEKQSETAHHTPQDSLDEENLEDYIDVTKP